MERPGSWCSCRPPDGVAIIVSGDAVSGTAPAIDNARVGDATSGVFSAHLHAFCMPVHLRRARRDPMIR